ncbi:hypothetical protein AgCh_026832 [Apium graveolens]
MVNLRRFLDAPPSMPPVSAGRRPSHADINETNFDTNMVIILAALLCALICALGLNSMVSCALRCGRRFVSVSQEQAAARVATTGVKKRTLRKIPVAVYGSSTGLNFEASECPICLGEFLDGEKVQLMKLAPQRGFPKTTQATVSSVLLLAFHVNKLQSCISTMKEAETWTLSVHAKTNKFNLNFKAKRFFFPNFYQVSFKLKTRPRISSLNKSKTLKSKFIKILKKCRFKSINNTRTGATRNSSSEYISCAGPNSGTIARINKWIASGENYRLIAAKQNSFICNAAADFLYKMFGELG